VSAVVAGVQSALGADALSLTPGFGPAVLDVAREAWLPAVAAAAAAGATYADVLTAYDELDLGFAVVAHVSTPDASDHVLLRTRVPREEPELASVAGVHRGLAWHERSAHEMFGIRFAGNGDLSPLRLQPSLGAHPLRKDFVLAARVARPWPGEKDPAGDTGRARRRTLPPGVPEGWGPA
jgi:NADH-quinone oxidoreductase subunit C